MLKMVDGTGIIGVDMVCPLGGAISPPQPPNYDNIEMEGVGSLMLPNSLKAPLERVELIGNSVQLTTTGKNLFDKSKAVTGRINPDNGVLLPETSYTASDYIEVQEGETYFQTGSKESYYRAFYDADKKFTSIPLKGSFQITVPVGSKFLRVSGKEDINNWQIEKGAKSTPYEPYTGLKPSPSPEYPQEIKSAGKWNEGTQKYEVDVKVTGKNLLDIKDITSETPQWLEIPCLIKNNIYIKSNNSTVLVENNQARLAVCFKDGTSRVMYDNLMADGLLFKVNSENPITTIKVRGTHIKSGAHSDIQVEYGNAPTPYEPYTEQSVQIALNEPLRGIGEYKDTITKDGVVRKIYEQTLKKERISMNEYNWDTKYFRLYVKPDKKIDSSTTITRLFSNMFKGFTICKGNSTIYWLISEEEIRSMGITEADCREVAYEKIKDFVTNNDIVVQYPIVETTLEPLSESVQAQLSALHSENGTTHVFVDSGEVPCGIKLTYRKEK